MNIKQFDDKTKNINININININKYDLTNNLTYIQKQTQILIGSNAVLLLEDFLNSKNPLLQLFLLHEDMKVIGYALYQVIETAHEKECELFTLLIGQEFQNKKYGQYLLKESLLQLQLNSDINQKSTFTCFLEVRSSNISAIHCYEKIGFSIINRRKNYYQQQVINNVMLETEDAVVMQYSTI
jgi:ribosomal protein S18 acetylase RimI-like enzyme